MKLSSDRAAGWCTRSIARCCIALVVDVHTLPGYTCYLGTSPYAALTLAPGGDIQGLVFLHGKGFKMSIASGSGLATLEESDITVPEPARSKRVIRRETGDVRIVEVLLSVSEYDCYAHGHG